MYQPQLAAQVSQQTGWAVHVCVIDVPTSVGCSSLTTNWVSCACLCHSCTNLSWLHKPHNKLGELCMSVELMSCSSPSVKWLDMFYNGLTKLGGLQGLEKVWGWGGWGGGRGKGEDSQDSIHKSHILKGKVTKGESNLGPSTLFASQAPYRSQMLNSVIISVCWHSWLSPPAPSAHTAGLQQPAGVHLRCGAVPHHPAAGPLRQLPDRRWGAGQTGAALVTQCGLQQPDAG